MGVVVVNVGLGTLRCHDQSDNGYLTVTNIFAILEMCCMPGAAGSSGENVFEADDGRSDESGGGHPGSGGDGDRGGCVN